MLAYLRQWFRTLYHNEARSERTLLAVAMVVILVLIFALQIYRFSLPMLIYCILSLVFLGNAVYFYPRAPKGLFLGSLV
ncbi:hypothetical protein RZS08_12350, partial [Arthrospira platensis SPKY1]|nr:hypothetical protein [Arthrospira platensis SPKY1]